MHVQIFLKRPVLLYVSFLSTQRNEVKSLARMKRKKVNSFCSFQFTSVFQLSIYNLPAVFFIGRDHVYFRKTSNEIVKKKRLKRSPQPNQNLLQQKV